VVRNKIIYFAAGLFMVRPKGVICEYVNSGFLFL